MITYKFPVVWEIDKTTRILLLTSLTHWLNWILKGYRSNLLLGWGFNYYATALLICRWISLRLHRLDWRCFADAWVLKHHIIWAWIFGRVDILFVSFFPASINKALGILGGHGLFLIAVRVKSSIVRLWGRLVVVRFQRHIVVHFSFSKIKIWIF